MPETSTTEMSECTHYDRRIENTIVSDTLISQTREFKKNTGRLVIEILTPNALNKELRWLPTELPLCLADRVRASSFIEKPSGKG